MKYIQLTMSRLMMQLSDPAELLAVHVYFPDMLLLRLLNFSVPVFSSRMFQNVEDEVRRVNTHCCCSGITAEFSHLL